MRQRDKQAQRGTARGRYRLPASVWGAEQSQSGPSSRSDDRSHRGIQTSRAGYLRSRGDARIRCSRRLRLAVTSRLAYALYKPAPRKRD